jgi:hypothetical protein
LSSFADVKLITLTLTFNSILHIGCQLTRPENTAGEIALRGGFDYLMFIDDDVMIQPDTFKILYETKKDIAAGLVVIRGMPFNVMAFRWEKKEGANQFLTFYNDLPLKEKCADGHEKYDIKCLECAKAELQEVVDCDAIGFSVCLIDVDVLKPLTPPFFMTGPTHTEDVYFCLKTKELEPNPTIVMNTRVQPGHLLNPEPIEFKTRKKFFDFYEATAQKQEIVHRDKKHVERVMASLGIEVFEETPVSPI